METFTVRELAIYLRCSQSVIRKLVTKKEIPFYNVGKRILFRKEAIDNWVYQQENNIEDNTLQQGGIYGSTGTN